MKYANRQKCINGRIYAVLTGRNSDNGMSDGVAKVSLSGLLHLDEDHGGNLFRSL